MRRFLILPLLILALFAGSSAIAEGKVPGFGTEDTCACGGTLPVWYYIDSSPPGGGYIGMVYGNCQPYQIGWISYTWSSTYRYTVQCR